MTDMLILDYQPVLQKNEKLTTVYRGGNENIRTHAVNLITIGDSAALGHRTCIILLKRVSNIKLLGNNRRCESIRLSWFPYSTLQSYQQKLHTLIGRRKAAESSDEAPLLMFENLP